MISARQIALAFGEVRVAPGGMYCFTEKTSRAKYSYFLLPDDETGLLAVTVDSEDEVFAHSVLSSSRSCSRIIDIEKRPLPNNIYGFDSILCLSGKYHGYFKGRAGLSDFQIRQIVPIYSCEFSGNECVSDLSHARSIIPLLAWHRKAVPKILLRFDNPKTRGGTINGAVWVKPEVVEREIANLLGVSGGFAEVENYSGQILEIVPSLGDTFNLAHFGESSSSGIDIHEVMKYVRRFCESPPCQHPISPIGESRSFP